ncbi:hypothetical protein C8R46DRAFT_868944, partial [Mycena filopes]
SRTQLPLTLAWAITIYEGQGLSLNEATIDIGDIDFSSCLSLVAISRVKKWSGSAFRKSFGFARVQKPFTESMQMLEEEIVRR